MRDVNHSVPLKFTGLKSPSVHSERVRAAPLKLFLSRSVADLLVSATDQITVFSSCPQANSCLYRLDNGNSRPSGRIFLGE